MLVMGTYFYPKTDICVFASSILQHYKALNAMLENILGDFCRLQCAFYIKVVILVNNIHQALCSYVP